MAAELTSNASKTVLEFRSKVRAMDACAGERQIDYSKTLSAMQHDLGGESGIKSGPAVRRPLLQYEQWKRVEQRRAISMGVLMLGSRTSFWSPIHASGLR